MDNKLFDKDLSTEQIALSWKEGLTGTVNCKLSVVKIKTEKKEYIKAYLSDTKMNTSIVNTVFTGNKLYEMLETLKQNKKYSVNAEIKFIKNKTFETFEVINLEILSNDEEVDEVEKSNEEKRKLAIENVRLTISEIKDEFLRTLCENIYRDKRYNKKIAIAPATEMSGYAYRGGLINMISDMIELTKSITETFNGGFSTDGLQLNRDLMLTGTLLCNVGRAVYYDIDKNGIISKTESGIMDADTILSRDIISLEIAHLKTMTDERDEPKFEINSDLISELVHMVTTSKSKFENAMAFQPRSKHSAVLSDIVGLIATKGLFEDLEAQNKEDRLAKSYSAGKTFVLFKN